VCGRFPAAERAATGHTPGSALDAPGNRGADRDRTTVAGERRRVSSRKGKPLYQVTIIAYRDLMERTFERHHYLHLENVPLSEAVREAVDAHERSEATVEGVILDEDVNVEVVDRLFTETLGDSEDVSLSLQMDLPNVHVDLESDYPISIRVTDREG
jgi:hypothetical protein